jgi:hypothetical protein
MANSAHYGTTFSAPVDIIFMTSDTLFMKRRQQGDRYFFCQFFFVTPGTFAPLATVSVAENIEIMVADPASKDGFVQIMVELHRMFMMPAKFPAFKVHDACIGEFILGPSQ